MAVRFCSNILECSRGLSTLEEVPRGSNDGRNLRDALGIVGYEGGLEWCLFYALACWQLGSRMNGYRLPPKYLQGSTGHLLMQARADGLVLPAYATGAVVLFCHADGSPYHAGVTTGTLNEGTVFQSREGNSSPDGSPEGYGVFTHAHVFANQAFISFDSVLMPLPSSSSLK